MLVGAIELGVIHRVAINGIAAVLPNIVEIEDIGLMTKGARNPLPRKIVRREVGIEQVRHEPVGARLPFHSPEVHEIGS